MPLPVHVPVDVWSQSEDWTNVNANSNENLVAPLNDFNNNSKLEKKPNQIVQEKEKSDEKKQVIEKATDKTSLPEVLLMLDETKSERKEKDHEATTKGLAFTKDMQKRQLSLQQQQLENQKAELEIRKMEAKNQRLLIRCS